MKIAFVLPAIGLSGGIYVIFEHATRINNIDGIEVYILTDGKTKESDYAWHPSAKELVYLTLEEAKSIEFTITIATWWGTVRLLPLVNTLKLAYFVQSIESKFYPDESESLRILVDSTYSHGIPVITEATWIKEYLFEKYNCNSILVKNGIRKDVYNTNILPIEKIKSGHLRVLVEGPLEFALKNVMNTLRLCKLSDADEVWLLTSSINVSQCLADRVFSRVPINEVPQIYRSCDVIVKLSYVEGMFGPPLEMFHCGGTAIVYNVTGHEEYIVNGYNSIVVPVDNENDVIKAINDLKYNTDLLKELKKNALTTANDWYDWGNASNLFFSAIKQIINEDTVNTKLIISGISEVNSLYNTTQNELAHAHNQLNNIHAELHNVYNSKSWKITKPLRWLIRILGR